MRRNVAIVLAILGGVLFAGCSSSGAAGCTDCAIPPQDLPPEPVPCATYCKEYVEPVYRKVPTLVEVCPAKTVCEKDTIMETRYREVMVEGPKCKTCEYGGGKCDQALVQAKPGGWRWKSKDDCCWKYEYDCPEYKWCNKVVEEESVKYCCETAPKYETRAYSVPIEVTRRVKIPAKYEVKYVDKLYRPGHYRWVGKADQDCSCSNPGDGPACAQCGCKQDCGDKAETKVRRRPRLPRLPMPKGGVICNGCARTN